MSETSHYAIFLQLKATEAWLRLPRGERRQLGERHITGVLQKYPALRLRHFDAEALSADCSDIMMIETADLTQYYDFIEMLRDSPFVTTPYFQFVRIIPTIEDGYRNFEARHP